MRTALLLSIAFWSIAAFAGPNTPPINLGRVVSADDKKEFHNVPNDAGHEIHIVMHPKFSTVSLTDNGIPCQAQSGNLLICGDGSWRALAIDVSSRTVCSRGERNDVCKEQFVLEGGSIERP